MALILTSSTRRAEALPVRPHLLERGRRWCQPSCHGNRHAGSTPSNWLSQIAKMGCSTPTMHGGRSVLSPLANISTPASKLQRPKAMCMRQTQYHVKRDHWSKINYSSGCSTTKYCSTESISGQATDAISGIRSGQAVNQTSSVPNYPSQDRERFPRHDPRAQHPSNS
jgi:hypothetical protein